MINGFEYYDYYYHLKHLGFRWENIAITNLPLSNIYEITLYIDEKTISKKFTMDRWQKYQICLEESRMMYSTKDFQRIISVTSEYTEHIAKGKNEKEF